MIFSREHYPSESSRATTPLKSNELPSKKPNQIDDDTSYRIAKLAFSFFIGAGASTLVALYNKNNPDHTVSFNASIIAAGFFLIGTVTLGIAIRSSKVPGENLKIQVLV